MCKIQTLPFKNKQHEKQGGRLRDVVTNVEIDEGNVFQLIYGTHCHQFVIEIYGMFVKQYLLYNVKTFQIGQSLLFFSVDFMYINLH